MQKIYLLEHFPTVLYKVSLKLWVHTIFAAANIDKVCINKEKRVEIFWGKLTGINRKN